MPRRFTSLVTMHRAILPVAMVASVWMMTGCDSRTNGDPDGVPLSFSVRLERPFVDEFAHDQWRLSTGVDAGPTSGPTAKGSGGGPPSATSAITLIGGDVSGHDNVFRQDLSWGETMVDVPLTPGRKLAVAVRATGAQDGWYPVGTMMVPSIPHSHVLITLTGSGALMTVTDDQNNVIPQRLSSSVSFPSPSLPTTSSSASQTPPPLNQATPTSPFVPTH